MRYIVIADVHGEYDKMIAALTSVNFDKNKDCLIVNGDIVDRGPQVKKCVDFVLNLPHKIVIWGNHEDMLYDLLHQYRYYVAEIDGHNGVPKTAKAYGFFHPILMVEAWETHKTMSLRRYFSLCVNAVQIGNYIITHASAPLGDLSSLHMREWKECMNANSLEWYEANRNKMKYTYVIGHFWSFLFRDKYGTPSADKYGIFEGNHLIALDGCSNAPQGKVNAFVIESDDKVIIY